MNNRNTPRYLAQELDTVGVFLYSHKSKPFLSLTPPYQICGKGGLGFSMRTLRISSNSGNMLSVVTLLYSVTYGRAT